ncbi:prolargin [Callorhinchus milii]|uniref:Proline and arginine rich end leucine rich repeat protein n=1 Tax=Callorhinchus milii TaxID=7868 RepID=A0A4W3GB20_CALMI|nr:prolargin [Callorhinchus milii]XP_007897685.1 prolargin [Callorhinchus milii]XP_042198145.1 prolargin [Callorhinchus milii]|eukprot:gi/632963084/ref/XP_007897684.1/ PREDICTED: prolargin [Callorhinchus milii]
MGQLGCILSVGIILTTVVYCQRTGVRPRPKRPKVVTPPPVIEPTEPNHATTLPPPFPPGPPSVFPDCPRECTCPTIYPNALYCDSRNLRVVPIIPSRIHYLYLQNNFIDSLPEKAFRNATELRWINLDNNRISNKKVDKKVFDTLTSLLFLYMEKNRLEEVPSNLPSSLEQLRLAGNQISKIPSGAFSKLQNLTLLDLHRNKLTDRVLNKNTFKGLKSLMQLNLAHNSLRKMPPTIPKHIFQLYLDKNSIKEIPNGYFNNFHHLMFLRLNFNQLTDTGIPNGIFNVSSLLDLHLSHNKLNAIPSFNRKLEHLYLSHNHIEKINGTEICPYPVSKIDLLFNDLEKLPRLRYLRLDGNSLQQPVPMDIMMCFRLLRMIVL